MPLATHVRVAPGGVGVVVDVVDVEVLVEVDVDVLVEVLVLVDVEVDVGGTLPLVNTWMLSQCHVFNESPG